MQKLEQLLLWLDGKKSTILAICGAVNSYLVAGKLITAELGALVQTILSILAGGAVYATKDMLGANRLGIKK